MKIIKNLENLKEKYEKVIMSMGKFDGIHIGHQKIIKEVVKRAKLVKGTSLIFTFEEHPLKIVAPNECPPQISSLHKKINLFKNLGIDILVLINFDHKFAQIPCSYFIENILVKKINCKEIYVGEKFSFGKNKEGNINTLKILSEKFNVKVKCIKEVEVNKEDVSSSKIRELIMQGKLELVTKLLNRPYEIYSQVVEGKKRGTQLGFPTANLLASGYVLPPMGVYAVEVNYKEKKFKGICNIGYRPTFEEKDYLIEVHLFNFNLNIYHQFIEVAFIKKIRNEQKFANGMFLKQQLIKDKTMVYNILNKQKFFR